MCGRYAQTANMDTIIEEFGVNGSLPHDPLPHNWNIAPTNPIYIVNAERKDHSLKRNLDIAFWGIIAPWEKDLALARASQSRAINARSESVHEKPTFRDAFRLHRCLIPATGYYEWATSLGKYKTKQPFYIHREDDHQIAFAGIFSLWKSPKGEVVQTAAVITRDAHGFLGSIHNRMPVMIREERWDAWLDPELRDSEQALSLMHFHAPDTAEKGLVAHPVSTRVNSVSQNGPSIIEPIELGEPETLF